ncbi:class I SAM-dependent methyltransferase [Propionibacteriaceae bacterium G1746]|uniref:class I SAM-dependent methyltransferase n=1 Tax=Aestuariimicrobium sp. G57 TaxID=3418485 RepID=UPI003C184830
MSQTRATLTKRRADVAAMFDTVASRYDLMNSLMTLGVVERWRKDVTAAIDPLPGMHILDLAAGTGASSVPLAAAGAHVFPTDMSLGMLRVGKQKLPTLNYIAGDALQLPYADNSFDVVTISYGLRNVEDTLGALQELLRVTKPGGQVVIAEFSTPTNAVFRKAYGFVLGSVIPTLSKGFSSNSPAYSYLGESIRDWPDQRTLADLLSEAGWRAVGWMNLTGGIVALHRGWKPGKPTHAG